MREYDDNWPPKIGDWIIPTEPIINQIHYGFNKRLIIAISDDEYTFETTCEAYGIEKTLWNVWNTEFVGRLII